MSVKIVSFALITAVSTSLFGCAAEMPVTNAPHASVGFVVVGDRAAAPVTVPQRTRARVETPPPPMPPSRPQAMSRGSDPSPERKRGDR